MNEPVKIRLSDLSKADAVELRELMSPDMFSIEEKSLPPGRFGELSTIGVIVISAIALKVLGAWLLRTHSGQSFRHTIDIVDAEGNVKREVVEYTAGSSEAPAETVLKQLAAIGRIDPRLLSSTEKNAESS